MDLILGLVFSFKMEKHVILKSRKGEEWLGEGGRRPPAAQLGSPLSARVFRLAGGPRSLRPWNLLALLGAGASFLPLWPPGLCQPVSGPSMGTQPHAGKPSWALKLEVSGSEQWGKSFFFPPKIWTAVCTNSGLFCTVCVPFFPFMQSSSALAAEICLAEKASPRVASEGRWSRVFCLCIWTFEGDAPARGILKALSYLKSVYLQPFVSGITLH